MALRSLDTTIPLTKPPSRRNNSLEPLKQAEAHNQEVVMVPHGRRRVSSVVVSEVLAPTQKLGVVPQKYVVPEGGEHAGKRLNSLVTSHRSASIASSKTDYGRRATAAKIHKQIPGAFNDIKDDREDSGTQDRDESSDSSDDDGLAQGAADIRHRAQFFKSLVGPVVYEDGGVVTKGIVDHRGITPHVVFSTSQTPPSEAKNPLVACRQPVTCGFCSSTNLTWVLRCSFCGSARMSDAPRLKYLIDMILSIDPRIKPDKVSLLTASLMPSLFCI
ncbi:unnamed protein product [Phytophthora lilii]|uniref:Unnamed protein product n=1 Tax=Phytophthora lilii TaxID=2077276 RepID=A0A9W6WHN7_9STRA|nr:unnamed protein product [Phytophthora lilii]